MSCGLDRTIKLWDVVTKLELVSLEIHSKPVSSVSYSPDGLQLVSCSDDKTTKITPLGQLVQDKRDLQYHFSECFIDKYILTDNFEDLKTTPSFLVKRGDYHIYPTFNNNLTIFNLLVYLKDFQTLFKLIIFLEQNEVYVPLLKDRNGHNCFDLAKDNKTLLQKLFSYYDRNFVSYYT